MTFLGSAGKFREPNAHRPRTNRDLIAIRRIAICDVSKAQLKRDKE